MILANEVFLGGAGKMFSSKIPSSNNFVNNIQAKCEGDEILYSYRVDDESSESDLNVVEYGSRKKAFTEREMKKISALTIKKFLVSKSMKMMMNMYKQLLFI